MIPTIEQYRVQLGFEGFVDHIIDLDAPDPEPRGMLSLGHDTEGEIVCGSSLFPIAEKVSLEEYAQTHGIDDLSFEDDAPVNLCSHCWSKIQATTADVKAKLDAGVDDAVGTVGYLLRWKQKGRASEEWYDIIVRPETTFEELDTLICRFTTLDDIHLRVFGLEDEYEDSTINVFPHHMFERLNDPRYTDASTTTIGEIAEQALLWEGDQLTLAYDLATPIQYYCLVTDTLDHSEVDDYLTENPPLYETETAAIVDEKRPDKSTIE